MVEPEEAYQLVIRIIDVPENITEPLLKSIEIKPAASEPKA